MSMITNIGVSALSGAFAAGAVVLAGTVSLQDVTPGVTQIGHSHISGYSLAGRFGAGTSPTLARVQVVESGTLQGVRAESGSGVAVFGKSTAAAGLGAGGYFTTSSVGGRGIVGDALSGTGSTVGGLFYNRSTGGGVAVWGRAIGAGTATGVFGEVLSGTGTALAASNAGSGNSLVAGTSSDSLKTTGVVPRHDYPSGATAASAPLAYGVVLGGGTIFVAGTGNWTVAHPGTGLYDIDVAGVSFSVESVVIVATAVDSSADQFCTTFSPTTGDLRIQVFDISAAALADSDFYFAVYRTQGSAMPPVPPQIAELDRRGEFGNTETWAKKDPVGLERFRKAYVAWQLEQTKSRPYDAPVDGVPHP